MDIFSGAITLVAIFICAIVFIPIILLIVLFIGLDKLDPRTRSLLTLIKESISNLFNFNKSSSTKSSKRKLASQKVTSKKSEQIQDAEFRDV